MEIFINGTKADFLDSSIQYVINSPLFQEQGGEAALELQFPLTARNKAIFGFAHRPECGTPQKKYEITIHAGGVQKKGIGVITEAGESYKINVGFEASDFYHKINKLTLRDLPFETISIGGNVSKRGQSMDDASINRSHIGQPIVYESKVSVYGLWEQSHAEELYEGLIDIPNGYSVRFSGHLSSNWNGQGSSPYLSLDIPDGNTWKRVARIYITGPFDKTIPPLSESANHRPYTSCRIHLCMPSQLIKGRKYEAKAELLPDSEGITLHVAVFKETGQNPQGLKNLPYPDGHYILATVYNPSLVDSNEDNVEASSYTSCPLINYYENGTFPETYSLGSAQRTNLYCPFPYVAYVFELIAKKTGYTIGRNIFIENPELGALVLYNNFIENKQRLSISDGNTSIGFERAAVWGLRNHMSDMKVSEFVRILNLFGVFLFADNQKKIIDLIEAKEILKGPSGFSLTTQLSNPVTYSQSFDSYKLSFNPEESFAQDKCVDVSKDTFTYYPESSQYNTNTAKYNDLVHYDFSLYEKGYYLYTVAECLDESGEATGTSGDGFVMEAIAISPYTNETENSQNPYSVECPLGPIFSGTALRIVNRDYIFGFGLLDAAEKSDTSLNGRTVAYAEDHGIFTGSKESAEDYPVMALSFYRGIVEGLPTISHDVYYYEKNAVGAPQKIPNASISLLWEGENGLYQTFWKPFLDWLTRRARKAKIRIPVLPVADFMKLKTSYRVRINQQNYLIDTIQADLGDKVTNIEIEAYTC